MHGSSTSIKSIQLLIGYQSDINVANRYQLTISPDESACFQGAYLIVRGTWSCADSFTRTGWTRGLWVLGSR